MNIFETIIIAIVEGLTEFLPVSSTGHMIIAQNLLGVESTDFVVWRHPLCTGTLLETFLPTQPHTPPRRDSCNKAFLAQI